MSNRLSPGLTSFVLKGGTAVQVATSVFNTGGGYIQNPYSNTDQNLDVVEELYVSLTGTFNINPDFASQCSLLAPGQTFIVPAGSQCWVNSTTSGHKFTAVFIATPPAPGPPLPIPGMPGGGGSQQVFPPLIPTNMSNVIPSYLYQEYSDDDDLQEFVEIQNELQQNYIDTFNALNLPIYTGDIINGALLDWVGSGIYGYARPVISSGLINVVGPLNTYGPNFLPPNSVNGWSLIGNQVAYITSDDTYKRCITWHYQKGDGKYCNVRWMKRRIMRFLVGENGTSPLIDQTNQISITFGANYSCCIRFVLGDRTVIGGAMPNVLGCNGITTAFDMAHGPAYLNDIKSTYVAYSPLPFMSMFQQALSSGVLETPFQFDFGCTIG